LNTAAVILQIESGLGCDNAEALAAVPGVDAIMVGTSDLRMDLGFMPGTSGTEDKFLEAFAKVDKACKKHNKHLMCFVRGHEDIITKAKQGVSIFICGIDVWLLAGAARQNLAETRKAVEEANKQGADIKL